jgi:hypothetical protein
MSPRGPSDSETRGFGGMLRLPDSPPHVAVEKETRGGADMLRRCGGMGWMPRVRGSAKGVGLRRRPLRSLGLAPPPKLPGEVGDADGSEARRTRSNWRPTRPPPPGPLPRCRGRKGRIRSRFRRGSDRLPVSAHRQISDTKKPRPHTGAAASHQRTFVPAYASCSSGWPMELSAVSSTGDSASETPWWDSQRSASSAAMQPVPAAVMAWR